MARRGLTLPANLPQNLEAAKDSVAAFVEATSAFTLDPWQHILCERLERLRYEQGARLLVHAPPQAGKSIIVSQRWPAWMLAHAPTLRVKLACYNVTHATAFGKVLQEVLRSPEYSQVFPSADLHLPAVSSNESWAVAARRNVRDAQPSFKALGLATGFVGQGADLLIIDDPYASPQDAASEVIRASTWMFWDESARPRIKPETNVVVMFHRYHEDDLAGRLWAEGGWEMMRFAAVADSDPLWPDPMGRAEGEKLSPRMSDEHLGEQQRVPMVWLGQFQGRPTAREGLFFKISQLQIEPDPPVVLKSVVRAWDMAATAGAGAYSAGVKMGRDEAGLYWILDVVRGQWSTDERDAMIKQTAALDGKSVRIRGPQDPGAAGVQAATAFTRLLAGYTVRTERVSGDKETRADPFSSQVNAGNVRMVTGDWNKPFIEELRTFPQGKFKDQVDAAADAFADIHAVQPISVMKW